METKKRCTYCGNIFHERDYKNKGTMFFKGDGTILGDGTYASICSDCVETCHKIIMKQRNKKSSNNISMNPKIYTPGVIKQHLDEWIIGQERAKVDIATEIYNHLKRVYRLQLDPNANKNIRIEKSNIILVGPTGSGKSEIVKSVANLMDVPYTKQDSTTFSSTGYVGRDVEEILRDLFFASGKRKSKAERGIVFLDEFDKLSKKHVPGGHKDVSGLSVQQALLTMMEGAEYEVKIDKVNGTTIKFDTSQVLFIVGGAFEGIDEIIQKRLDKKEAKPTLGFGSTPKNDKNFNDLIEMITQEDIINYGIIPEIIGRCPVVTTLKELTEEALENILTKPKHAIIKQYQEIFALDNVALEFEDEAIKAIAKKAKKLNIGARALRNILELTLKTAMFEVPNDKTICKVTVNKDLKCEYTRKDALIEIDKILDEDNTFKSVEKALENN